MQANPPPNWRSRCAELQLNPQEVKAVSQRFDMYKSYTDAEGGDTLPLERWYSWYRVEKISEGHGLQAPPVQGCSVGPDIEPTGPIVSEADFLELLIMYREAQVARQR